MSASDAASAVPTAGLSARRLVAAVGLALACAYPVLLIGSALRGEWLVDASGHPIINDFVTMWSAGLTALAGTPTAAWDWPAAKELTVAVLGRPFPDGYPIFYPPHFLLLAAPFSALPWLPAMAVWLAVTTPLYVATVRGFLPGREGTILAFAFPAALWNVTTAQNAFLTTALLGGAMLALPRRPVLAGCLIGLMTYKPQYGVLIPLVLVAGGQWRAIAAAAAVTAALVAVSWLVLGGAAWVAFVQAMPAARETFLTLGLGNWTKLQSVFGLVRSLGGSELVAWTVQGGVGAAVAAGLWVLWRSPAPHPLKAAGLAAGALLVTPYAYIYDMTLLVIPVAVLLRGDLERGFRPGEAAGLALVVVLLLVYPVLPVQVGLAASLVTAGLLVRRATPFVRPLSSAAAPSRAPGRAPAG
ncbi:glycosyltransferase family 87 protein [Rhodoplanes roseus]|uniref:DUF2029 domain-containing protein n=1 Tax=Rhodoplanes roseus TaxID=29409 RepID=A0A327KWY7_9BRAD|nr:glycosyltransferase family 87 protein [Rhodoplanes roseus]RAI42606.1 hypothetical protein CH341_18690 [Rhodoplanes roseus]